ncbi:MAG: VanZ family protein [Lachnospiraceae bacterium]|nr:VanZ family protein [Lachnospiraceae bacterium]
MQLSKTQKIWLGILFVLYLAILIFVLFFSPEFGRTQGNVHGLNLVPFREIKRFYKGTESLSNSLFWRNVVGNIIAFFPMGLLVALLAPKRPYCVFALAIVYLSCAVAEILQYVFNVGSFDIDDVILNTLGGFIGILVSIPVRRLLVNQNGGKKKQSHKKKR